MPVYVYILIGLFLLSFLTLFLRIGVAYCFAEPDKLTLRIGLLRKTVSLKKAEKTEKKEKKPAKKAPARKPAPKATVKKKR